MWESTCPTPALECQDDARSGCRRAVAAAFVATPKGSIVRARRWRRIESGQAKSITDLAEQEGVTDAYVCRLLPLTCLAPDIIEAILDGRQSQGLRLAEVLGNGPVSWEDQRASWGFG
jgi:hypothetical protein